MNRIFGFFKEKIIEAKEENKQELQALASVLLENEYSSEKVLGILQNMKANYMNWNILIANEASTGLYFSQLHNRNICLRKIKGNEEMKKQLDKNKMKLQHIQNTATEIKEISELSDKWATTVNQELESFNSYLRMMKKEENKGQIQNDNESQQQLPKEAENESIQNINEETDVVEFKEQKEEIKIEEIIDESP